MTERELIQVVASITGVPVKRIILRPGTGRGNRDESDARYLVVLAVRYLWPHIPTCRLGELVGLSHSGSSLALTCSNRRFKNDSAFRQSAKNLFDAISATDRHPDKHSASADDGEHCKTY